MNLRHDMSVTGQSRHFDDVRAMSAHPPILTAELTFRDGRKVPLVPFEVLRKRDLAGRASGRFPWSVATQAIRLYLPEPGATRFDNGFLEIVGR